MGLPGAILGLLAAVAVLLLWEGCAGSSSHSLHIFSTLFMGSSLDGAQYIVVVYVDDQLAARFDPTTRRLLPQVAWLLNVKEEDSHLWNTTSQRVNSTELWFRNELHILHVCHNSSRGFHSWQNVIGCKLSDEGQTQGIYQYGYDGEDFISLDQKTLSWTAISVPAQKTKRRWEAEPLITYSRNDYLENICIKLLQKCIMYGKDSLLRKEPPVAAVTCRIQYKSLVTLDCRVYGFYPKEVNVTWRKDGEVWKENTSWAGVLPNSDGTYHTWLSIEVDLEEKRDHYRCYVEHAGLPEPLIVAWEEPVSVELVVAVTLVVVVVLVSMFYVTKSLGATGRVIATTSQEFEMRPRLRDQDQRQQDQDQRQQDQDQRQQDQDQRQQDQDQRQQTMMMMKDFHRKQMKAGPLGPLWDSC